MKWWHWGLIAGGALLAYAWWRRRTAQAPELSTTAAGASTSLVTNPPKPGGGSTLTSLLGISDKDAHFGALAGQGALSGNFSSLIGAAKKDPGGAAKAAINLNPLTIQAKAVKKLKFW